MRTAVLDAGLVQLDVLRIGLGQLAELFAVPLAHVGEVPLHLGAAGGQLLALAAQAVRLLRELAGGVGRGGRGLGGGDGLRLDPGFAQAKYGYALALAQAKRYEEARKQLAEGAALFPARREFADALAKLEVRSKK